MTYYKIIQNGMIIDAGFSFYKWNPRRKRMFNCSTDDAEFVGGSDGNSFYRDDWMKPYPKEASRYDNANVVVIDETEYREIIQSLNNEEIIIESDPNNEDESISENLEEKLETEEAIMTVSEMRKIILMQQQQIDQLLKNQTN